MEFYVKPQTVRGGKDGSGTHADPWLGLHCVDWDLISPGDVLYISGQFYNMEHHYKPFDILRPGVKIIGIGDDMPQLARFYPVFDNMDYVTLENIFWFNSGQIRAQGAKNLTLKNCILDSLDTNNLYFVELAAGNDGWLFDSCTIRNCGSAIYSFYNIEDESAERLTVTNCKISQCGSPAYLDDTDNHAIGTQGGSGHRFIGNQIEDTGTAICCWARLNAPMRDIGIEGNRISRCRAIKDGSMGSGIEISGTYSLAQDLPRPGWRARIRIATNQIEQAICPIRANIRDAIDGLETNQITNCIEPMHILNPFGN